jgi:hypothetical protein
MVRAGTPASAASSSRLRSFSRRFFTIPAYAGKMTLSSSVENVSASCALPRCLRGRLYQYPQHHKYLDTALRPD